MQQSASSSDPARIIGQEDGAAGKERLIRGIEEEARAEAERLLAAARQAAGSRLRDAERQAAGILEEARRKAREQVESIRRRSASAITLQIRRIALRSRGEAILRVRERVDRRLQEMVRDPTYREILLGWIVEAAIGLNLPEARLSVSAGERRWIDGRLLRQAEEKVQALTGHPVRLEPSTQPPPAAQGVLLTSPDGRIAYNNQVPARIARSEPAIRRIIHEELFGEQGSE